MQVLRDEQSVRHFALRRSGPRKRENAALEPLRECAKIARQLMLPRFLPVERFKRGDEEAILATSAGIGQTRFEFFAFRAGSTGDTGSDVGPGLELLQDVKHIAVTRRIGPGNPLPPPQGSG